MIDESFASGTSVFHRTDPRLKVAAATVLSFQIALSQNFATLGAALLLAACMAALARLPIGPVARRLLAVNGFVLFLSIILPATMPGEALFSLGPVDFTLEGVLLAARIALKCNAILLCLVVLAGTSTLADLGWALHRLRVPDKMVYLLLLTYRYVFVIEQEYRRLVRAAKVRCFRPGTDLHTYRTYAYLAGMLFVRAAARAERVYRAMVCRGFSGRFHSPRRFAFSRSDALRAAAMAVAALALGYLEWKKTTLY